MHTVYVQCLSLRQRCLSKEFGSLSSCKPKVCVLKSSLSNSRPPVHLCLYLWSTSTSLTYTLLWWCRFYTSYRVCYSHTRTWTHAHALLPVLLRFLKATESTVETQTEWLQKCSYLFYLHRGPTPEIKEPWLTAWLCSCRSRVLRYLSSLLCSTLDHQALIASSYRVWKRDAEVVRCSKTSNVFMDWIIGGDSFAV